MEQKPTKLHLLTKELEAEIEKTRALRSRMWPKSASGPDHHLSPSDPWLSKPKKKKHAKPKKSE